MSQPDHSNERQKLCIHAVIVDDEPLARRGIRQLLARHADIEVVAEAGNGIEAAHVVRTLRPDLVFLDIRMPGLDGFAAFREFTKDMMPSVIFVTASNDHAVNAFDIRALDYLVKPLNESRFSEAIDRVRQRLRTSRQARLAKKLFAELKIARQKNPRIVISTPGASLVVTADEIDWLKADDYYAIVHVRDRDYLIRESLASFEGRLDGSRFLRVHRSAIVNIDRVSGVRIENGETLLELKGGLSFPVSRRRRSRVLRALRN